MISRARRGERNGRAKLNEAAVREIRNPLAYKSVAEWAEKFNVSKGAIYQVINRTNWAHIYD